MMSRLTWDGIVEPVSREAEFLRRERGQGTTNLPCSADNEQNWQPYPVDPYSCYVCNHTYALSSIINSEFLLYTIIGTTVFFGGTASFVSREFENSTHHSLGTHAHASKILKSSTTRM